MSINIDEILRVLNEAIECDESAINKLISFRVGGNQCLADHPTIEVGVDREFGFLGLLNGITRLEGGIEKGTIAAFYDDDGKLIKFERYSFGKQ